MRTSTPTPSRSAAALKFLAYATGILVFSLALDVVLRLLGLWATYDAPTMALGMFITRFRYGLQLIEAMQKRDH